MPEPLERFLLVVQNLLDPLLGVSIRSLLAAEHGHPETLSLTNYSVLGMILLNGLLHGKK